MINKEEQDKEIILQFEDGRKAKILHINDIDTQNIINELSRKVVEQQQRIKELETDNYEQNNIINNYIEIEKEHQELVGELIEENKKNKKLEHKIREIIGIYDNSSNELTVLPNNEVVCLSDIAEIIDYLRELLKEAEETKDERTRIF